MLQRMWIQAQAIPDLAQMAVCGYAFGIRRALVRDRDGLRSAQADLCGGMLNGMVSLKMRKIQQGRDRIDSEAGR